MSQANIHEGNAVIALKASATGDIVWSWHIWVYGGDDLKVINVKNNQAKSGGRPGQDNFDFLSENLGSCYDGDVTSYSESKVWVKVSNGRKEKVIKIIREAGSTTASQYNSPYYQWGRKDPMLPSSKDDVYCNKVWYDKSGVKQSSFFPTAKWASNGTPNEANTEIANTIKNPQTFNTSYSMDNLYYNLWDTNCNEICGYYISDFRFLPATKSVYDPCPPGFCLSPNGAITGFTISGDDSNNPSEFNVSGSFDKGWHFRTVLKGEPDHAINPTIFFPASGFRNYDRDGLVEYIGYEGRYWSSVLLDIYGGSLFFFYESQVYPAGIGIRAFGHSVRPVKEN